MWQIKYPLIKFQLIIFFVSLLASTSTQAIIMPETTSNSVGLYLNSLRWEQSDGSRDARGLYSIMYQDYLKFSQPIHYNVSLLWSEDHARYSKRIKIKNDYLGLVAGLGYSYVYLFRYSATLGLGLLREETRYRILGEKENSTRTQPIYWLRTAVDYAITDIVTATLQFYIQQRAEQNKFDWSYGIGVNYMLSEN